MEFSEAEKFILTYLLSGLSPAIYYHDILHTMDVLKAAEELAIAENISNEEDLLLLKTAALFHDSGFVNVYQEHEEEGCRIARENLPNFGYNMSQIDIVCNLILSTKMPQNPDSRLGRILCDADLDYLGRDDYEKKAQKLYDEWKDRGKIHSENEWEKLQIEFLESHHYWTGSATVKREKKKAENLLKLKDKFVR